MISKFLVLTMVLATTSVVQAESRIYGGVKLGINSLSGSGDLANNGFQDEDKSGYLLGGKVFFSQMEQSYIFDIGLGYGYNQMKGSNVDMKIRAAYGDLALKYRLDKKLSIGLHSELHFGTETSYAQQNSQTGENIVNVLAGGQIAYDTAWGRVPVRYEASILTNLNGDQRNIVGQVGINFSLWEKEVKKSTPKPVPTPAPRIVRQHVDKEEVADVKVVLKFAKVAFGTDEYRLDPETQNKLVRLGKYLAKNPDLVKRIKISGHTDERGGKEYNQVLSKDRADSVVKTFVESGVDETKVESVGYGFSRPVDTNSTPEAWEKNRRTEIEFFGVKDRVRLNKALEHILK